MKRLTLCMGIFSLLLHLAAFGEIVSDQNWGYVLDLPEGYSLIDSNGTDRYQLTNQVVPVDLIIALYPKDKQPSAQGALTTVMKQLGALGKTAATKWREQECVIGQITMTVNEKSCSGWILALELPEEKGQIVLATFTPVHMAVQNEGFMVSTLDCLGFDRGSWFEAGPMTAFAFQEQGKKEVNLTIAGKKIRAAIDKIDGEANQYLIDREFQVLEKFAETSVWKEAWQRYYRIIFRDAYKRLDTVAFEIYNSLQMDGQALKNDYDLANSILAWIQTIPETRNLQGSDFTSLPELLTNAGGDCDSKALLFVILMQKMNYQSVLFISRDYSHAVGGIALSGAGARMSVEGISYLIAETTAKVQLGLIAQNVADPAKWIPVRFYQ